MGTVRGLVLELAGSVYYRVDTPLQQFPFCLLKLVHPACNDIEKLAAAQNLYRTPECDLDPYCSARVRALYTTAREMFDSLPLRKALAAWMNRGKVTTGHVERMHTYNQSSFRATRKVRRQVEGAVYHCFLRKCMAFHKLRGRLDYSLPQNDAKFVERRLGLRLAQRGKG